MLIRVGDGASTALKLIIFYCIFGAQKFVLCVKVEKLYGPLVVPCENAEHWYNPSGQLIERNDKKYTLSEGNLTVHKISAAEDFGKYTCTIDGGNTTVEVHSLPFIKSLDKSFNVVQGQEIKIECVAWGYPPPEYVWYRIFDDEKENMSAGSLLYIKESTKDDYGNYMCQASNIYGYSNATTKVRVKDKLAPLWPFIGILVEVVILVVIIIIYEKRKSKQDAEENAKENVYV